MERLQITTLSAQDISSALLIATYTADADRELLVHVGLSGLAGNGVYRACLTRQIAGAGAAYQAPTVAVAVSGGVTTVHLSTTPLAVGAGDVVKVYAQGLTGDTSVGGAVEVFDNTAAVPGDAMALTSGERTTLAAAIAAALTSSAAFLAAVATRVWAHTARTLTQTAAQIAAALSGTSLTIQRGDTLSITLTGLGDISGRSKLYFAIKDNALGDADGAALLFLEETAGLTVVNRAPHSTTANGSIVVDDEVAGNITITVKPAATALLPPGLRRYAAVEVVVAGQVRTLTQYTRTVTISADVVRATS